MLMQPRLCVMFRYIKDINVKCKYVRAAHLRRAHNMCRSAANTSSSQPDRRNANDLMFNNHAHPLESGLPWLKKCCYCAPVRRQSHLSQSSRGMCSSSRSAGRSARLRHCTSRALPRSGLFTNTLLDCAHMVLCKQRTLNSFPTPVVPGQPNTPPALSSCLHALLAGIQFNFLFKFTCNFDTVRLSLPVGINKHINRTFMSRGVLHKDGQTASKMKLKGSASK